MKMTSHPVTFDFDKKSYLQLLYENLASYETDKDILAKINSLCKLIDNDAQFILIDLLNDITDFVITAIASQKCVKVILDK